MIRYDDIRKEKRIYEHNRTYQKRKYETNNQNITKKNIVNNRNRK